MRCLTYRAQYISTRTCGPCWHKLHLLMILEKDGRCYPSHPFLCDLLLALIQLIKHLLFLLELFSELFYVFLSDEDWLCHHPFGRYRPFRGSRDKQCFINYVFVQLFPYISEGLPLPVHFYVLPTRGDLPRSGEKTCRWPVPGRLHPCYRRSGM